MRRIASKIFWWPVMQVAGLILDATYGKKEKHVVRTRPAWLSEDD